jgi:glycosyltransferase involved in cell wall biosynthesis
MAIREQVPRISVVVPSYNQGGYLDDCLESVVKQDHPDLEIIVMDGGSTDDSVSIIERYAQHLTHWQSQPDGGQTAAIVTGFGYANGDLLTWLNSDDVLLPGALHLHAQAFRRQPKADVFYGDHVVVDGAGTVVEQYKHPRYHNRLAWLTMPYIAQPGTSFTRRIWQEVGGADCSMHCAFDYDLWYRFMKAGARFVHVGGFVSAFRRHGESKGLTRLEQYAHEHAILRERYQEHLGQPLERRVARLLLRCIQVLSGAYLHTLAFRLFRHHRLSAYDAGELTNCAQSN